MTVSTAYSPLSYAGNGSTTAFPVTWPFFAATDLIVTLISSGGVETVKTLTTHYTVSGGTDANGLPATGTVTMITAPATGETLRIERATSRVQASTWAESDPFPQKVVEAAFDRAMLIGQEAIYSAENPDTEIVFDIGTVTTVAAGGSAAATVVEQPANTFTLNLTIPRGDTGLSGPGTGDLLAAQNLLDLASRKTGYDNISIKGADVASAATIDLDAATGNLIDVTGTTTITAITLASGRERTVQFTGALTLTNGASLLLPGGGNIVTAAGDVAIFRGYAAGVVRCVNYQRISHATLFSDIKQAATTTATGVLELSTTAEAATGTDTSRAVVPSGLFPAEADVASGGTTDLGAQTTTAVRITGTTTITSFGTANAGIRRSGRFAGALTLTHNATSLILPSGASITTAAGDTFDALSLGSGNWLVTDYTRANGRSLTGAKVVSRAYDEYTSNANLTTTIPVDDSIPQNTEGTQILSASITPSSTTNRVRVTFTGFGTIGTTNHLVAALFRDSGANAIAATVQVVPTADYQVHLAIVFEHVPATTSATTYTIRVGPNSGTARMNGTSTGRMFGGVARSTLVLEELEP